MSELNVTVPTPHGDVVLPYMQMASIIRCSEMLKFQGKEVVWHKAHCECCVIVHEAGVEPCNEGFLIGSDGGFDWITADD